MTEYKKGDKVVIIGTITHSEDEFGNLDIDLPNGDFPRHALKTNEVTHLEDFQPAQEKIQMTVEEKAEFDTLKTYESLSIYWAFAEIRTSQFPRLFSRLFENTAIEEDNKAQLEFSRAWEKPSRIEVIKPEHEFKVGDLIKAIADKEQAIVIGISKNVSFPIHILFSDGIDAFRKDSQIEFIKSNAINWEDGE